MTGHDRIAFPLVCATLPARHRRAAPIPLSLKSSQIGNPLAARYTLAVGTSELRMERIVLHPCQQSRSAT